MIIDIRGRFSLRPRAWLAPLATVLLAGCGAASESVAEPTIVASTAPDQASAPASAAPSLLAAPSAPSGSPDTTTPSVFGEGVISTDDEEWRISFTPDGETAYFARSDGFFPQTRDATIMQTTLVDGEWSEPVVAPFSGEFPGFKSRA